MSDEDKNLLNRLYFFRSLTVFISFISLLQLILAVLLPDILTLLIKTWLVVIIGGSYIGIGVALFLARSDSTITLVLIILSNFVNGLICGISIVIIILGK